MTDLNGTFEVNVTGWTADTTETITRQTTVFHTGIASALVVTAGLGGEGVGINMTGDAAQGSTWDASAWVQQHDAPAGGRNVGLTVVSVGGTGETFQQTASLGAGWAQITKTFTWVNASHTAARVALYQIGAGAAFNIDLDDVQLARHLTYLPSGNPFLTGLWVPGRPAANYAEPSDAATAQMIASGIYAGA